MATSLKIDDNLRERVRQLALTRGRSPHWIMREAIADYIERAETQRQFEAEAVAAWTSYQETGLHLSGDEVRAWLADWGTEVETRAPDCHG